MVRIIINNCKFGTLIMHYIQQPNDNCVKHNHRPITLLLYIYYHELGVTFSMLITDKVFLVSVLFSNVTDLY